MLTREEFMALHRHYIWGRVIKTDLENSMTAQKGNLSPENLYVLPVGAYWCIWYGMLYGVLEVLKEKRIRIPSIQTDIDSICDRLRLFRNAVFHPQPEYISPKLFNLMQDPESVNTIWRISAGLSDFFIEELDRLNAGQPGVFVKD